MRFSSSVKDRGRLLGSLFLVGVDDRTRSVVPSVSFKSYRSKGTGAGTGGGGFGQMRLRQAAHPIRMDILSNIPVVLRPIFILSRY